MQEMTTILGAAELSRLRAAFDPDVLLRANTQAFATVYPRLSKWGDTFGELFYGPSPLSARERELCVIAMLAPRAPSVSFSNHVYWGLMEGLSVDEIAYTLGLAGSYDGMPTYVQAMLALSRTLHVLQRLGASEVHDPATVLRTFAETIMAHSNS
jgi:alkylhydroperoxidase/carboxymuconolactone decarboxylase family protein YurZ